MSHVQTKKQLIDNFMRTDKDFRELHITGKI
jgi:hypothetical protein